MKAEPKTIVFPTEHQAPPRKSPLEEFVEYVQYHLSEAEAIHLLGRLADDRGCKLKIQRRMSWEAFRDIAAMYPGERLQRFTAELKQREAEGRWLVQPRRPST